MKKTPNLYPPPKIIIESQCGIQFHCKEIPSFNEGRSFFGLHTSAPSHLGALVHWCQEPIRDTAVLLLQLAGNFSSSAHGNLRVVLPCGHTAMSTWMTWWQVFFSQSVANCDYVLTLRSSHLITPPGNPARTELSALFAFLSRKHCKKKQKEGSRGNVQ